MLNSFLRIFIILVALPLISLWAESSIDEMRVEFIEQQLVENIFVGKWGLDSNECQILLAKLRIAEKQPDYQTTLVKLYDYTSQMDPSPIDPNHWDDSLDAPEADSVHEVLLENDHVRILYVIFEPSQSGTFHTHKWAGIVLDLIPSDFVIHMANGEEIFLSSTEDPVFAHFEGQSPHYAENVGEVRYVGLHFEIKS